MKFSSLVALLLFIFDELDCWYYILWLYYSSI